METCITQCKDCAHCFKNHRSRTGYSCEVWGYDDFACDVPPDGYCFKSKKLLNNEKEKL